MIVSIIILGALVGVGIILYIHHRLTPEDDIQSVAQVSSETAIVSSTDGEGCCGMHITCEKDSLSTAASDEIIYYDDEELDTYRGRISTQYDDEEIEQFRDVLLTLMPHDIAGWARSIQLRGIAMPDIIKDELLMIVAEARAKN